MPPPQAKTGGWSKFGSLYTALPMKSQLSLQANFPVASNYTVQFGVNQPANGSVYTAEGLVEWTVEGNHVSRRVSISQGVSLTAPSAAVKVTVLDTTVGGSSGVITDSEYKVGIQVAPGSRSAEQQPPTLFVSTISVTPGTSGTFLVPTDSGAISAYISVYGLTTAVAITDKDVAAECLNQATILKTWFPRDFQWVPLAPGTTSIKVLNNFPALGPDLQFSCTLGIDG